MGFIMEKESSFKDAATHYEAAWRYSNKVTKDFVTNIMMVKLHNYIILLISLQLPFCLYGRIFVKQKIRTKDTDPEIVVKPSSDLQFFHRKRI